jgi:hypothetical protein
VANSGISKSTITGVGKNFTVTVPAYSTTAILMPQNCTGTAITPYLQVNSGAWEEEAAVSVAAGSTVTFGPQPTSGGSWNWTGPKGFVSTSRQITVPLNSSGANVFAATYTNASGCVSTETFTVAISGTNYIPNGTYAVTTVDSALALGDPNSSTTAGTDMEQLTFTGATNQQWTVNNLGNNVITLQNVASGQMLDVVAASKTAGALIDQWPANGDTNQEWTVVPLANGAFELTSVVSGLALDVDGGGTAIGEGIDQWYYGGNPWQQWKFTTY